MDNLMEIKEEPQDEMPIQSKYSRQSSVSLSDGRKTERKKVEHPVVHRRTGIISCLTVDKYRRNAFHQVPSNLETRQIAQLNPKFGPMVIIHAPLVEAQTVSETIVLNSSSDEDEGEASGNTVAVGNMISKTIVPVGKDPKQCTGADSRTQAVNDDLSRKPDSPNQVHQTQQLDEKSKPFCDVCNRSYVNRNSFEKHQKSKKHANNLKRRQSNVATDARE